MTKLGEFTERGDDDPVCPVRGCNAVRMTPEDIKRLECDTYFAQPDESIGQYWVMCVPDPSGRVHHQWIHSPPRRE